MNCKSFYNKNKSIKNVVIITLLSNKNYENIFSENFGSYDKYILKKNVDMIVHTLERNNIKNKLKLDYVNTEYNVKRYKTLGKNTVYIYGANLHLPPGVQSFEETTKKHPRSYCHPKQNMSYSLSTRYYTNQMLKIQLLKKYDFFFKIDADVKILQKVNLLKTVRTYNPYFLHTKMYTNENPLCDKDAFKISKKYCFLKNWENHNYIYYSNFIGGNVDLFTSDIIIEYSDFMWNYGWNYRWGDQTFWRYALLISNTTNKILDKSVWRGRIFRHKNE